MKAKRSAWIPLLAAMLTGGWGCEGKKPQPEPAKEEAPAPAASPQKSADNPAAGAMFGKGRNPPPQTGTVFLERIWVVRSGNNPFGGIQPCSMVIRGIWTASQHTAFELDFVFSYRSGGRMVTKRFTRPMKQMHFMMDHPTQNQYVRLDTVFDVSDAPVDQGTAVTGSVQLMHSGGKRAREAASESVSFSLNISKEPPPAGK